MTASRDKGATSWAELKAARAADGKPVEETLEYQMERLALQIGRRIHALRIERGWTQTHLAALAGFSQPHIAKLEAGRAMPKIETLTRLADAFDSPLVVGLVPQSRSRSQLQKLEADGIVAIS